MTSPHDRHTCFISKRQRPELPQETEVHIAERSYGAIRRAFELPKDASREKIDATYKDGVTDCREKARVQIVEDPDQLM